MPTVKERWFSDLVGPDDGNLLGAFSSCSKEPMTNCSKMSGFRTKKREAVETTLETFSSPEILQKALFINSEDWMKMYNLEGVCVTPASFLLTFKAKKLLKKQEQPSDVSHGVLCMFSFKTQEYVYHW